MPSRWSPAILLYLEGGSGARRKGRFIQVIEGVPEVIARLYGKIRAGNRHQQVTLLVNRPLSRRDFSDWPMGYQAIDENALKAKAAIFQFKRETLAAKGEAQWDLALHYLKDLYALRQCG